MNTNKLIINFTPTGMIPTKEMTSYVPITVNEIVDDVLEASELGITMVHLHARDEKTGVPSYKKEIYAEIIEKIRAHDPYLVICVSLSGRNFKELNQRSEVLDLEGKLKPDMGSLTLSSLNFNKVASVNSPEMIMALASKMKNKGIVPELEAFDLGMINFSKYLIKKDLIKAPYYYNLLLGNIACSQPNLLHAGMLIQDLPEDSYFSLAGIGAAQLKMNSLSIAIGGGVRVGIEDNIWFDIKRTELARNRDLIKRVQTIAHANEREVMTSQEFRWCMQLNKGNGEYGRDSLLKPIEHGS